jgi:hypothetical protein
MLKSASTADQTLGFLKIDALFLKILLSGMSESELQGTTPKGI